MVEQPELNPTEQKAWDQGWRPEEDFEGNVEFLTSRMTSSQIEVAKKMAEAWQARQPDDE